MLLQDKTTIKFQTKIPKILCASTAYNGTFVLVRLDRPGAAESIVQYDANGKIVYERKYEDIIDFFAMMNDKEVIVLNVAESKIDIINLQTQKIIQVNNQYLFDDTASMELMTFPETRLFCIIERGGLNDNRLRLTYYSYDGISEDSQPVAQWLSKDNEWAYENSYARANAHSKILIWTYQHDKELVFSYFDLKDNPKGSLQTVKCKITAGDDYGVNDIQLKISYLWEIRPNVYMLVAISNKSEHKDKCKNKNGICNNNYIIDASLGNEVAKMREVKFDFKVDGDFFYNDQLTDCFGLGSVSVFHTFRHKEGQVQDTPVYYVNNETEEIIHVD
jgi:hypothetical protein